MMLRGVWISCFVVIALNIAEIDSKNSYLALVPSTIRPGLLTTVNVNIFMKLAKRMIIKTRLLSEKNTTIVSSRRLVRAPGYEELPLLIPKNLGDGNYRIQVEGICGGGRTLFRDTTKVHYSSKSTVNFIQTDKGIYKPGQTVHLRAFSIYPNMKVVCQNKDIVIYDSQKNRIKQWLNQKPRSCVFEGHLKLTEYTNLGDWTIEFTEMGQTERRHVTVDEYVLPKFEVDVTMPPYLVSSMPYFTGKVTARYTFGKPVQGRVLLKVKVGSTIKKIEKTFAIHGEASFRIWMRELGSPKYGLVTVTATVTESITGYQRTDKESRRVYDRREKLKFTEALPRVFKPKLPFTAILRITQQDDTLLHNPQGMINITIKYNVLLPEKEIKKPKPGIIGLPFPAIREKTITLSSTTYRVPPNGVLQFQFTIPQVAVRASVTATYKKAWTHLFLQRAESPSNSYILLDVLTKKPKAGRKTRFSIRSTRPLHTVMYQVFSKGNIIRQGKLRNRREQPRMRFWLRLRANAAPRCQVLVYYVTHTGEVVTDSVTFSVDGAFRNKVRIKFSKKEQEPGKHVSLKLRADPYSLVYVVAIDKSVLLLKSGNDITQKDVLTALQGFDNIRYPWRGWWWWWFPIQSSGIDAFSVFRNAGLQVLTDTLIYRHVGRRIHHRPVMMGGVMFKSEAADMAAPARVRKNFPETWWFTKRRTNKRGRALVFGKVPDTLTTWVASAFAVNARSGLGVAPATANLTAFQSFFIRLNLPYSAIRGEILILQVDVFNYASSNQYVSVTLEKGQFRFADANGNPFSLPGSSGWTKKVYVPSGDVRPVFFVLIPTVVGKIKLKVDARSVSSADAVERVLQVEAEGIPQRYSIPTFIDLRHGGGFSTHVSITFPTGVVPDSEHIQVTAIGDTMGTTLNGIENLLQMSYGCGEQNLVRFVPNVFITNYLQTTGRLTPALKKKSEHILEQGYQRQLRYKHTDGSFSAFGNRDKSGSTWLTAFVLKSFAQAKGKIYIDTTVMTKAIEWLLKQQTNGEFKEPGRVLHKAMQGGSISSKKALTAFVLIALQEAKDKGFVTSKMHVQVNNAIDSAAKYISDGVQGSGTSMYELAITAYALKITGHHLAGMVLHEIEKLATEKDGMKYWTMGKLQPYKSWKPPVKRNSALDIEVTSYVLLVYGDKHDVTNGIKVIKWLSTQRNKYGGFVSTQDTVLAIQAMTEMAKLIYTKNFNIVTNVNGVGSGSAGFHHAFTVNDKNALVLQIAEAPSTLRAVDISATGRGICFLEIDVRFNIERELRVPSFALNYTISKESLIGFRIDVCYRWLRSGSSSMVLLEVGIPTGMAVDLTTIDTSKSLYYKRADQGSRKIDIYFDKATDVASCVGVNVYRVDLIARHKPVPIQISDYYEPSNKETILYQSTMLHGASIAQVCGSNNCTDVQSTLAPEKPKKPLEPVKPVKPVIPVKPVKPVIPKKPKYRDILSAANSYISKAYARMN